MARDSLMYFAVIFVELLVSTIVWARAPQYINILNPWSAALPSLLGSRLMLNMREAVYRRGLPESYIVETFVTPLPSTLPALYRPQLSREVSDTVTETEELSGDSFAERAPVV
ncbi:hypothetical protein PsYK624_160140 [Phanerochaete sordida]|uniref:Uncharacterized protein n=1 Tax=Phanerochaete sordida TaxID=48140 RepID=A0A9P3GRH9_9APHY|nr:hypothetical protein PsYK624_160140 [Phanerochaete sordida]